MASDNQKRILYVENGIGYGGAVICLLHLARNLDKNKFVCRIVTGRTGPDYELIGKDLDWHHVPDRHVDVVSLRRQLDECSKIRSIPLLYPLLSQIIARLDDLANFLPFFLGFWKQVKTYKPDLIHTNNDPSCNRAAVLVGKLTGTPTVSHSRGTQPVSWMAQKLNNMPDHMTPVSHWIDQELGALGVPSARRTVVYDGIDLEKLRHIQRDLSVRQNLHISESDFAVGLVGLLIPWKGQEMFIDAAQILKDKIPGLKMMIIGGTPDDCKDYEAALRTRVTAEGLSDIVVFTGHVRDMPPLYQALDIVVSASTQPEPLGTVVIEAMALGRPLIAPNHGGGAEMNTDGVTALLFKPGDPKSFSDSVLRFYQSEDTRKTIGQAARERAFKTFDVATHVATMQNVYSKVLEQRRTI